MEMYYLTPRLFFTSRDSKDELMHNPLLVAEILQTVRRGHLHQEPLVTSQLGFLWGSVEMSLRLFLPYHWVLPVGGALISNLVHHSAVLLLLGPVDGSTSLGFNDHEHHEQHEAWSKVARLLSANVLSPPRLVDEILNGRLKQRTEEMLRNSMSCFVPESVVKAVLRGLREVPHQPITHPIHSYMEEALQVKENLHDLLQLSLGLKFKVLFRPVLRGNDITLVVVRGYYCCYSHYYDYY